MHHKLYNQFTTLPCVYTDMASNNNAYLNLIHKTISLVLPDCFFPFVFVVAEKRVWWHSQYRVVSTHHHFCGVLIGKINTTLIYVPFVILLFSIVIVQSSAKPIINKSYVFECVLMDSNSTPIIMLMCCCISQYCLCHQTLFPPPQMEKAVWQCETIKPCACVCVYNMRVCHMYN